LQHADNHHIFFWQACGYPKYQNLYPKEEQNQPIMKTRSSIRHLTLIAAVCLAAITGKSQSCQLTASATTIQSDCKATGSITVSAANGSGNYNYTVSDSGFTSTTSTNIISGLSAGVYKVLVKDINNGCTVQLNNVTVAGNYQDPRFTVTSTDVTCSGAANGTITVGGL
jgi:hypothetical protein